MNISILLETSSDSSSDSESDLEMFSSEDEIERHPKVTNFMDVVYKYSGNDFKKHFRLEKTTAILLIDKYSVSEIFQQKYRTKKGHKRIDAKKEIYIFLWYVANTEPFRTVANLFGVSIYGCWQVVKRVTTWLISVSLIFVKWPENLQLVSSAYEAKKGLPQVVGAIDGTDIKIKAPKNNKEDYFNRKHFYSLKLQAVVGPNKEFFDVYCGEPGSLHDGRMLRKSPLFHNLERNGLPNNYYIVGDSAYPCGKWIVSPFRDNGHLTYQQIKFNKIHSSTRIVVENAFGWLKTRFRRIYFFTEHQNLESVINITAAACVLHNICIQQNDELQFTFNEEEGLGIFGSNQDQSEENFDRRNQVLEELISKNMI